MSPPCRFRSLLVDARTSKFINGRWKLGIRLGTTALSRSSTDTNLIFSEGSFIISDPSQQIKMATTLKLLAGACIAYSCKTFLLSSLIHGWDLSKDLIYGWDLSKEQLDKLNLSLQCWNLSNEQSSLREQFVLLPTKWMGCPCIEFDRRIAGELLNSQFSNSGSSSKYKARKQPAYLSLYGIRGATVNSTGWWCILCELSRLTIHQVLNYIFNRSLSRTFSSEKMITSTSFQYCHSSLYHHRLVGDQLPLRSFHPSISSRGKIAWSACSF